MSGHAAATGEGTAGPGSVLVVGNGVAAWMAAAVLGRSRRVQVLEEADGGLPDPFEADAVVPPAVPGRPDPWRDEDSLVLAARGACGWGIALGGWAARDRAWFHPFGSLGAHLGPVPFHQLAMRLRAEGKSVRLADYSLAALAAQAGRFARPTGDARSVLSTCRYALHLDVRALRDAFRAAAEAAGAACLGDTLAGVTRADDGSVAAVATAGGQRLQADLFLDCTAKGALTDAPDWEDWSEWLPCERALSAVVERRAAPPPYVHAEAHAAGWTRHLPLRDATVVTSFWSAGNDGERAALDSLRHAAGRRPSLSEPVRLRAGRRRTPWLGNCVALGAAAATIDPVAVSNLELLRSALARLLELLPGDSRDLQAEAREYNRRTAAELDNARDYAVALYKTNGRRGEPFWDERRAMRVPESLDYRMRLYGSLGRVALYDEEPLEETSWISLFDEQGPRPPRHHPLADGFATADLEAHLARVRAIMIEELKKMPGHGDFLQRLAAEHPRRTRAAAGEGAP